MLPLHLADEVEQVITGLGVQYTEMPRAALFIAAQAYRAYRQRGGANSAPLPDFFIGAHAQAAKLTLLTRDRSRYTTYFPGVALISP